MKRTLKNKNYTEKMIDEKIIKRTLQLFIRFLKEEKLLGTFNRNVSQFLKKDDLAKYIKYNNSYSKYVFDLAAKSYFFHIENIYCIFLDHAMVWDETENGFKFWQSINRKWERCFLNNIDIIKKKETNEP